MIKVLLSGASGFIGRQVLTCLQSRPDVHVRALVHRQPVGTDSDRKEGNSRTETRVVDLNDPDSLDGITEGIDVLLHLGHRIVGSAAELERTNVVGTLALTTRARASGVRRLITLSTSAVYGSAFTRGPVTHHASPTPTSPISASRLRADDIVTEAGGTVIRPHLVYGPGDRWVLPRALDITSRIGWVDGGKARHSFLHVHSLARGLVILALTPTTLPPVMLAASAEPLETRAWLTKNADFRGVLWPHRSIPLVEAVRHHEGTKDPRWEHDIRMLATDSIIAGAHSIWDSDTPYFG